MDGAFAAGRVAAHIEMQGEPVVLTRGATTLQTYGVRIAAPRIEEAPGASAEQSFDVKIAGKPLADAAWPGAPLRGDFLTVGGRKFSVRSVDSRFIGAVAQHHVLTVSGTL